MKNEFDRTDETQWVDDQLASLDPSSTWQPNPGRALDRLTERHNVASARRWGPISMSAVLVAAVGLVLLLLPWQVFLKPMSAPGLSLPIEQPKAAEVTQTEKVQTEGRSAPVVEKAVTPSPELLQLAKVPAAPIASVVVQVQDGPPYSVGNGVTEPKAIYRVNAEYTEEAKASRIQGSVQLLCVVGDDGTVHLREITKKLGYGLDESAVAAVTQWRFEPGTKDGKAVPVLISVLINFTLR